MNGWTYTEHMHALRHSNICSLLHCGIAADMVAVAALVTATTATAKSGRVIRFNKSAYIHFNFQFGSYAATAAFVAVFFGGGGSFYCCYCCPPPFAHIALLNSILFFHRYRWFPSFEFVFLPLQLACLRSCSCESDLHFDSHVFPSMEIDLVNLENGIIAIHTRNDPKKSRKKQKQNIHPQAHTNNENVERRRKRTNKLIISRPVHSVLSWPQNSLLSRSRFHSGSFAKRLWWFEGNEK